MNTYECQRCSGKGTIKAFSHVIGGVCLKCKGSGKQSTKPQKPSKSFSLSFLWDDESDVNYNGGDFCRCATIKAKTMAKATEKAEAMMRKNGSKDFKIEEL